jgi:uncharacterized delta-60 repeat protein
MMRKSMPLGFLHTATSMSGTGGRVGQQQRELMCHLHRIRHWFMVSALTLALMALLPQGMRAQSALDGFAGGTNGTIYALAEQPDGKILIGGSFTLMGGGSAGMEQRFNIGRLNPDGSLDVSFNPGALGVVRAIVVQADGKILIGGTFSALGGGIGNVPRTNIGRLNPNGSVEAGFDPGANSSVYSLAVQADGKILVGGNFSSLAGGGSGLTPRKFIGRLNADGTIDPAFDPGTSGDVLALAVQPDGKILVGGAFTALGGSRGATPRHFIGRVNADGIVDATFDPGANNQVRVLKLQHDGRILVGGDFTTLGGGETGATQRNRIGRLHADGSLDADFDPGANAFVRAIEIQADGRIVVAGSFATLGGGSNGLTTRNFLGRLLPDGSLDDGFDPGADAPIHAVAVQADSKILVGGAFSSLGGGAMGTTPRSRLGRLYADGSLDADFNPGTNGIVLAIALQADGKILIGGSFTALGVDGSGSILRNHIARLRADGSIDGNFKPGVNGVVNAIALQPDGKILVGGSFTRIGEGTDAVTRTNIGRLNPDGSLDVGFDPGVNGTVVSAIAIQADGTILVGGNFTGLGASTGTVPRSHIGRLNPDGSVDMAFNPGAGASVNALAIQPDGKILVGGNFTTLGGGGTGTTPRNRIGRLNADGSLDSGFDPGADNAVSAIAVETDGRILVGGAFSTLGGGGIGTTARNRIGRLNANGSLSADFNPGANNAVVSLGLDAGGRILVCGAFTTLGGGGTGTTPRIRIGRLNADGSLDAAFNPGADGTVEALAIQADGKILVGGSFTTLGDGGSGSTGRRNIGRLTAIDAAFQNLTVDSAGSSILWKRGGTNPEVHRVTFEFSADGVGFDLLGSATRISGGWQLKGLSLPMGKSVLIRARGFHASGRGNGSGSIIESFTEGSALLGVFAQIAAGGSYQTVLTGINTGQTNADILVSLIKSDGTRFQTPDGRPSEPVQFDIPPMGTARFQATLPGDTVAGYGVFSGKMLIDGTALFKSLEGDHILSEAGVGLSKPTRNFTVYIDNTDNASSGYAVANSGSTPATLNLTLRNNFGSVREHATITLPPGHHFAEFANQRFPLTAPAGFEGSIEFTSDQNVAAVALRYDNMNLNVASQVFSTIPVLVDEASTTLFFPQVADGAGYRTNFIIINPLDTPATSVRLEFYQSDGTPLSLPIGGVPHTSFDLALDARGVARFLTDGTSTEVHVGWVRVTSRTAVLGSSIFQIRIGGRIISEAGVGTSPLTQHFVTYVENVNSAWSGLAICNPNDVPANLTLNLRRSTGEIFATTTEVLPAGSHLAKFFTYPTSPPWFSFAGEFEGVLEVIASQPVSAVALRYDNLEHDVFATLPVVILR